jgi:CBS domain-containing protein
MPVTLDEIAGLTAADIMHRRISTLDPSTTVAEVRDYFGTSGSRRLALFADGDRFAGALVPADLPDGVDPQSPAVDLAHTEPTVAPDVPATDARDIALGRASHRLPVVDEDGRLVGIVAIAEALTHFCGT